MCDGIPAEKFKCHGGSGRDKQKVLQDDCTTLTPPKPKPYEPPTPPPYQPPTPPPYQPPTPPPYQPQPKPYHRNKKYRL